MEDLKRPTFSEKENDLLNQQEGFYKQNLKPSAKFKRTFACSETSNLDKIKEKIKEKSTESSNKIDGNIDVQNMEADVSVPLILKEHDMVSFVPYTFQTSITKNSVKNIGETSFKSSQFSRTKKSIFAQLVDEIENKTSQMSEKNIEVSEVQLVSSKMDQTESSLNSKNIIDIDREKIHLQENIAKISSMPKDKILHFQKQCKEQLAYKKVFQSKCDQEDFSDKILRKEGRNDCDALLIEKMQMDETEEFPKQKLDKLPLKGKDIEVSEVQLAPSKMDQTESSLNSRNIIDIDREKIHQENLAKISSMPKDKILHLQEQYKAQLNPDLVKFFQSKQKTVTNMNETEEFPKQKLDKLPQKDNDIEILESLEELLEKRNQEKWENMHKIEKEKLEWITDLPKAIPVNINTGSTARFNFEGKLLVYDLETPTYKGLHHHGKEPEIAGYSLEELFLLARSTVQSQRITALHTLAHILDNYWSGQMDSCFDTPLLSAILEAGIVPLLRWALDDISVTSIAATIAAMHSLLICKPDQICLDRTFCWLNGHILPQLQPPNLVETNIVIEELTDADLIKLDVTKAFLRMDVLPRFSYILHVLNPPPLVCRLIIEICCHLSQHSTESATQVMNYPGLFTIIFRKFLPSKGTFIDGSTLTNSVNYCSPLPSAVKLVRIFAASSKENAKCLMHEFDLFPLFTHYLTLQQPSDDKVPLQEIQRLKVETLKVLHTFLSYGFGCESFLEPIFLDQMHFYLNLILSDKMSEHLKYFEYATHLFKAFEVAVASFLQHNKGDYKVESVFAIYNKALQCTKKLLWQYSQTDIADCTISLLSSSLNFLSIVFEKIHKGIVCEDLELRSKINDLFKDYLLPCIESKNFNAMIGDIQSVSLFLCTHCTGNKRDSKTLVSLGSMLFEGDVVPLLKENTPVPLLLSILNFAIIHAEYFVSSSIDSISLLLNSPSVVAYLKKVCSNKIVGTNWFSRYESLLLFQILKLSSIVNHGVAIETQKIAAALIPILKASDEWILEDLFENIIFRSKECPNASSILTEVVKVLPVISKSYVACLLNSEAIMHSKNLVHFTSFASSMSDMCHLQSSLTNDWCYAPILKIYKSSQERPSSHSLTSEEVLLLTSSLQWIYLCHESNIVFLEEIPGAAEFSYLCMVFLLSEDYFRMPTTKELMKGILTYLLKNKKINLSKLKWNTLLEYDTIYSEIVTQFEAVSYGDDLYGSFLLFPLQMCYPSRWKKMLFSEHSQALRFLRIPPSKLLVPLQHYLKPFEKDIEVLSLYFISLNSGTLTFMGCPVLYIIAIHHLNHFIFSRNSKKEGENRLLRNIILCKKTDLSRNILLFSEINLDHESLMTMKDQLSTTDLQHLKDATGLSIGL